jgi:hypothetical protein
MQPRNLPAAEAELELPLGFADELVLGADVLLPHAAASRPATVRTAPAASVFFTGYLLFRGAPWPPVSWAAPPPGPHAFQAAAGVSQRIPAPGGAGAVRTVMVSIIWIIAG